MSRFNYFTNLLVDGYAFPDTPQVNLGFNSQGIAFLNKSSIYTIQYSFNGTTIHGDLDPADESKGIIFDHRIESKIWFRAVGGYATVRVEAWSK